MAKGIPFQKNITIKDTDTYLFETVQKQNRILVMSLQ